MLHWLKSYRRELLAGDIGAGIIVALMLIPQGMAYAIIAGLSPVAGLYASILPPVAYVLFGSSMVQSVGPMAITSLMIGTALAPLAATGSPLALALTVLWLARQSLARGLKALGCSVRAADTLSKLAPVLVLLGATVLVRLLELDRAGVRIVGPIPSGLPALTLTLSAEHGRALLAPSLLIGFMVFLSSQSAAVALAQKRGERIVPNHELLGLGAANLASAVTGGFAVTGSMSRSAVNYAAGANTPLATIISAGLLACALSGPTDWLSWLPLPVLAATIILAVLGMIDLATLKLAWRYDHGDAAALLATLAGVLVLGVEEGVLLGVALSLATLIWRSSRPHIAILGKIPGSEHFRNIARHQVETLPGVLMLRIDSGLFFGNVDGVIAYVENLLATRQRQSQAPAAQSVADRDLVLVMSGVNLIDTSGLYAMMELNGTLRKQGVTLHLAEVKGPVMDRLCHSDLIGGPCGGKLSGEVFLSAALAFQRLAVERQADPRATTSPMTEPS